MTNWFDTIMIDDEGKYKGVNYDTFINDFCSQETIINGDFKVSRGLKYINVKQEFEPILMIAYKGITYKVEMISVDLRKIVFKDSFFYFINDTEMVIFYVHPDTGRIKVHFICYMLWKIPKKELIGRFRKINTSREAIDIIRNLRVFL